ncbi:ADP-ribosylglycohydrolase family protein [Geobacter sp.]|uniref:ADP-ribosylglycohydrolase family protein n=1 Tax=Geobacter sp. TaxID=46610 RepID=UPI00262AD40D|nr:ADP-ribosylglycohydrolase family protein [Geobacter sp.]
MDGRTDRGTAESAGTVRLADRFRGAAWGQFVGDAVCLGSHWIYELEELERRFQGGVLGFETPADGHYHAGKRSGELTHYGDGALVVLRSVAETGRFDPQDFGRRFVELFGSDAYRGYLDHATRETLDHWRAFTAAHPGEPYGFQDGADDDQPATATRLVPVVIAHWRDDSLPRVVEAATRVCQNNDRAVAYMRCHALILRELFAGTDLHEAFHRAATAMGREAGPGREVAEAIRKACASLTMTVRDATLAFGQSCPLGSSFPAAVHCALRHSVDFAGAALDTANAGGDSAARAALIGAWLGAFHGIAGIPAAWRERLADRDEIERDVEELLRTLPFS